jgi:hypothetical protein
MITSELQDQVFRYIDGKISMGDLQQWYVPRLPILLTSSYTEELVSTIELGLIEVGSGLRSEGEFRELLGEFIRQHETITIQYPETDIVISTSASNQPITPLVPSMPYVKVGFVGAVVQQ